jgi:type II secretory pathway predicted ATPase ExeA
LEINPALFVGYNEQISTLLKNIEQRQKLILLSGPTGSGKTTIISYLTSKNKDFIYLSKPPREISDLLDISDYFIRDLGFLRKIFVRKPKKINDLPIFLDKIIKKPKVLFIDEAHEASLEVLEWFRVMVDHVKNLTIVFSALPVFEHILTKKLETLKKRITDKIELNALTKQEVEGLIRKRIEYVGGDDIKPFTYNIIEYIYNRTGGFPRDVILLCNKLLNLGAEKNLEVIGLDIIDKEEKPKENLKIENLKDLPEKQKLLINIIAEKEPITPNEIVYYFKEYPSEKHALRAINNLLGRLIKQGYIEREKAGKTYSYKLSPSTRTILVRA